MVNVSIYDIQGVGSPVWAIVPNLQIFFDGSPSDGNNKKNRTSVKGSVRIIGVYLRKVTQKALELLKTCCHPTGVLNEQGIEVDHREVGELRIGLRCIAAWEGAEKGIDQNNSYL